MTTAEDLGIDGLDGVEALDVDGSTIFRARQRSHDRLVAVKILDPYQEPLIPRRFDLRRKSLTKFAERADVVPVHEVGTTPKGQQYLLMQYFPSGSLADEIEQGPMAWDRAAGLLKGAAETVAAAHELGVILGDIKPSSIMLGESGPSIAVYGMATRRFDDGRPRYCAPEATPGAALTAAADVYSLCLTLVAVVVGRPPNRGGPAPDFLAEFEQAAPDWLVEVVTQGLSAKPADRYRDAQVLAATLRTGLTAEPAPAPVDDVTPAEGQTPDLDDLLADAGEGDIILSGFSSSANDSGADPADPFDFEALLELPTAPRADPNRPTIGVDEFLDLDDVLGVGEDVDPEPPPPTGDDAAIEVDTEIGTPATATTTEDTSDDVLADLGLVAADDPDDRRHLTSSALIDPEPEYEVAAAATTPTTSDPEPESEVNRGLGDDRQEAIDDGQIGPPSADDATVVLDLDEVSAAGDVNELGSDESESIDLTRLPPPSSGAGQTTTAGAEPATTTAAASQDSADSGTTTILRGQPPVPGGTPIDPNSQPTASAAARGDERPPIGGDETSVFDLPRMASGDPTPKPPADDDRTATLFDPIPTATEGVIVEDEPDDQLFGPDSPPRGRKMQTGGGRPTMANPAVSIWDAVPSADEPAGPTADGTIEVPITTADGNEATLFPPRRTPVAGTAYNGNGSDGGSGAALVLHRDDGIPFGGFERRADPGADRSTIATVRDGLASIWVDRRPGLTGLLAFLAFVAIAGVVLALLVRDFRPSTTTTTEVEGTDTSISIITGDGGNNPVIPTAVPPVLPEPASTHVTQAARGTARRLTTTVATTLPPAPTSPAAPTSGGGATTAPTTDSTAASSTAAPATTEGALPPLGPVASGGTPEGPTEPAALIRNAGVSRIGPTSARITFDSPQCVTVLFTFSATGGGPTSQLSGGNRCSNDHTLLLGTVTPPLAPGTAYTVVITASNGSDADRSVLRFTTTA